MGAFARVFSFKVLGLLVLGLLVVAPSASGGDALILDQHLPTLRALVAHSNHRPAVAAATEPICDIFANGFDQPGATACAGCFDATVDFEETDVDCGGNYCKACAVGKQCIANTDCQSGTCSNNVCAEALLISQVQTRGENAGNDEFVEIYNPGDVAVTFDASWTVLARNAAGTCTSNTLVSRFSGAGQVIPAHRHLLYVNSAAYNGPTPGDAVYTMSITDAASLVLEHSSTVVDALCFYYSAATLSALTTCPTAYICEGTPTPNPHNDGSGTNVDASLERKPGGSSGNMTDTDDNATDFFSNPTPDPHSLSSDPIP
jgi:hypothetical protein